MTLRLTLSLTLSQIAISNFLVGNFCDSAGLGLELGLGFSAISLPVSLKHAVTL